MDRRSDRETDPAAAAGCCIGIAHHELGAGQIIDEGDLRALKEGQGDGVNERGLAVGLDADVVGLGSLDQFEAILEAGAAAAVDSDAQHDRMALGQGQLGQSSRRALGQRQAVAAGGRRNLEQGGGLDGAHRGYMRRERPIAKARIPKERQTVIPERAPYAEYPEHSRGRLTPEPISRTRNAYARDRDRIIHATAFRRLKEKTQVFVAHEGDHYRTRLTHSLEVAQIARSLAHALRLDTDLAETVALAHDLGHPPFGHAGEDELQAQMAAWGGFDHNVQTFRVVTKLEARYPGFDGLNLSWETVEGVVKHNGPVSHRLDEPAWKAIADYAPGWDLRLGTFASLEAQAAAIADDIAYNNHDVDDGVQAGLFTLEDLNDVPLIGPVLHGVRRDWPGIDDRMLRIEAVRRMIGAMVEDVLAETEARIEAAGIRSTEAVRTADRMLVAFSPGMLADLGVLRKFLFERMYRHYRVNRTRSQARRLLAEMFQLFMAEPATLPPEWSGRADVPDPARRARAVCDYIAGMTDRYAIEEHRKLFSLDLALDL
jgi:dGTPase